MERPSINTQWVVDMAGMLADIAPTVLLDYNIANAWMTLADQFAAAVRRTAGMEAIKQRYADRIAGLASTHAEILAPTRRAVAIGWGAEAGQFTLYFPDAAPGVVLSDLGMHWVDSADGMTCTLKRLSYVQLNALADADVILTFSTSDGVAEAPSQQMVDQPLFRQLPAAQQGHVYPLQQAVPASYGAALELIDELEAVMTAF